MARARGRCVGWARSNLKQDMSSPATPAQPLRPAAHPQNVLSRAEARVLVFGAAGCTKAETALYLSVGEETVKSQRASIIKKFGARNFVRAVAYAFANGYLSKIHLERADQYIEQFNSRRAAQA